MRASPRRRIVVVGQYKTRDGGRGNWPPVEKVGRDNQFITAGAPVHLHTQRRYRGRVYSAACVCVCERERKKVSSTRRKLRGVRIRGELVLLPVVRGLHARYDYLLFLLCIRSVIIAGL